MSSVASVKDRLKNYAKRSGRTVQDVFTGFDEIAAFENNFTDDYYRQQRWRGFLKNKNVMDERSFKEAVAAVKDFLLPVIEAIRTDRPFLFLWKHNNKTWE